MTQQPPKEPVFPDANGPGRPSAGLPVPGAPAYPPPPYAGQPGQPPAGGASYIDAPYPTPEGGSTSYDASSWSQPPPPAAPPPPTAAGQTGQQNPWQQTLGSVGGDAQLTPQQERTWGMLTHLIPMVCLVLSAGTLGFVASLVIFLLYKDRGPFVRAHAANSLNVQIVTGIGLVVSAVLMLVLIGFITYPLIIVWAVVIHIIAASKASGGAWYKPPLTPRIVK